MRTPRLDGMSEFQRITVDRDGHVLLIGFNRPEKRNAADHQLLQDRLMNRAEHRLSVVQQCDQGAPQRHTGDERLGAVDRVEHPHELRVGTIFAKFFANDAVGREFFCDERAKQLLSPFVGGGHRRIVGFDFNGQRGVGKIRADKFAALDGEFGQKRAIRREIHGRSVVDVTSGTHGKIAHN